MNDDNGDDAHTREPPRQTTTSFGEKRRILRALGLSPNATLLNRCLIARL